MDSLTDFFQQSLMESREAWQARTPEYDRDTYESSSLIKLSENDRVDISHYLESPTRSGIWYCRMQWQDLSPDSISEYIWSKLRPQLAMHRSEDDRADVISDKASRLQTEKVYNRVTARLSTIMKVLAYTYECETCSKENSKYYSTSTWYDKRILESIDVGEIRRKFPEAYREFKESIVHEGFKYVFAEDRAFRLNNGFVILHTGPANSSLITMCSTKREPLVAISSLLEKLNKINWTSLRRAHSVEDSVFKPYFALLSLALPLDIEKEDGRSIFDTSISEYRSKRYSNCIRAIGLQFESYLKQAYETENRAPLEGSNKTIGQMIHAMTKSKQKESKSIQQAAKRVNMAAAKTLKRINSSQQIETSELTSLLQDTLHLTEAVSPTKPTELPWPHNQEVCNCIKSLLEYRNLASHRSHRTVGAFEAQQAAFCMVTFLNWWIHRRKELQNGMITTDGLYS